MQRKGVNYDVSVEFSEFHQSRPEFDVKIVHRELEIIKNDLHCNAIRISGTNPDRLILTAREALKLGFEVWLSPQLHDKNERETLDYIVKCAELSEVLRKQWPELVFILGCELTWFMKGIIKGNNLMERLNNISTLFKSSKEPYIHNTILNAFLGLANHEVRKVFHGAVTYASAPIEGVDWTVFDYICLDYYRSLRNKNTYGRELQPYLTLSKPIVITEVGCCAYQGAEDKGDMGWAIVDWTSQPPQLNGSYLRDESLQSQELIDMLSILKKSNVDGAFVFTFIAPGLMYNNDPKYDLDMSSYSLVKSYADKQGTTYPDLPWEPKESFHALATYFAK